MDRFLCAYWFCVLSFLHHCVMLNGIAADNYVVMFVLLYYCGAFKTGAVKALNQLFEVSLYVKTSDLLAVQTH